MWDKIKNKIFKQDGSANVNKLLLVIDDGEVERRFMTKTLEGKGYSVITAENGEIGIKIAKEKKPDAIFLDFSMPGLQGDQVCKLLKSDEQTKKIPVVFLSGSASPGKVIDCYDVGAEYYLAKPIDARTLLEHTRLLFEDLDLLKKDPDTSL